MSRWSMLPVVVALAAAPVAAAQRGFPTTPPPSGPAPAISLPRPVERSLSNGLRVIYVRQAEVPVVSASLVIPAANTEDPTSATGLSGFVASMLDEGAAGRSALDIADQLDLLGASLSAGSGWDVSQVQLYALSSTLPQALSILADVVVRPDFPEREVQRLVAEQLTALARARDEPATIAANAFNRLVFGAEHPYGRLGSSEATRAFTRDALVRFHQTHYRPRGSTLVLVGDLDPAALHPIVERTFGGWTGAAPERPMPTASAAPAATGIYLIDKPGAAQSEIRIGHPGIARQSPDYYPVLVMNALLGGTFGSRLNTNLREVHGYTYGAQSGFGMRRGAGPFQALAAVQTAKTDSALVEFFKELRRIRAEDVSEDELDRAKRYVALTLPQRLETAQQVSGALATLVTYGLSLNYYDDYMRRVMAVTAADVRRVANQYVTPERSVVVVVGDRSVIEPGVRALGLGPVEVRPVEEFVR